MRKTILFPVVLLMFAGILGQGGCGGDDDPGEPAPEECSLTLTSPAVGAEFLSDETANVRWTSVGPATAVQIELLQGGVAVGEIAAMTDNDGFFGWSADVLGGSGGADFSVRITALGQTGCTDEIGPFTIINTAACELTLQDSFPRNSIFDDGDIMSLTWSSSNATGRVGAELWHGHLSEFLVGVIYSDVADAGALTWTVDSFNDLAHRNVADDDLGLYWVKVYDLQVPGCELRTEDFYLYDDEICFADVFLDPATNSLEAGSTASIHFTTYNVAIGGTVDMKLYAGNVAVPGGLIASGVDAAAAVLPWVVDDFGFTGGGTNFNVRVFDSTDSYCWGKSGYFSIVD